MQNALGSIQETSELAESVLYVYHQPDTYASNVASSLGKIFSQVLCTINTKTLLPWHLSILQAERFVLFRLQMLEGLCHLLWVEAQQLQHSALP